MKKLFTCLFLLATLAIYAPKSEALTFDEAISQSKPCAVLIYADWADDVQNITLNFKSKEQQYAKKYNFVTLNIADAETKSFNKMYHIYPNLPYVLLFRDHGKVSRLLKKDCVTTDSCFTEKLNLFVN